MIIISRLPLPSLLAYQRDEAIQGYLFARSRPGISGELLRASHERHQFIKGFITKNHQPESFKHTLDDVSRDIFTVIRIGATAGSAFIGGFMMRQIEEYGDVDQWRMEPFLPK